MTTDIGKTFRALHEEPGLFVMPNPWDIGSTRVLEGLGFRALATTSGGMAYGLGKRDGGVSRRETLAHCRSIVESTTLPVSADLEKGFGDTPEKVAEIISDVAETGVAGCSIEDYSGNPKAAIFDKQLAVERIQAAAEACQQLKTDFVLTARCEQLLWGDHDLDAVIERLQAFESAGADVLFAPGLNNLKEIEQVIAVIQKPLNVIMSDPGLSFGVRELADAGVKRISIGSSFAQLAYGKLISAAKEIADNGTFKYTEEAVDWQELESLFPEIQKD